MPRHPWADGSPKQPRLPQFISVPGFPAGDALLAGMDDLISRFSRHADRTVNQAGQNFVDRCFNSRRSGGSSSGGADEAGGACAMSPPAPIP